MLKLCSLQFFGKTFALFCWELGNVLSHVVLVLVLWARNECFLHFQRFNPVEIFQSTFDIDDIVETHGAYQTQCNSLQAINISYYVHYDSDNYK